MFAPVKAVPSEPFKYSVPSPCFTTVPSPDKFPVSSTYPHSLGLNSPFSLSPLKSTFITALFEFTIMLFAIVTTLLVSSVSAVSISSITSPSLASGSPLFSSGSGSSLLVSVAVPDEVETLLNVSFVSVSPFSKTQSPPNKVIVLSSDILFL